MIEPPCTELYARWCERAANQLMVSFLLDARLGSECVFVSDGKQLLSRNNQSFLTS